MGSAVQSAKSFEELLRMEEQGPYVFSRMFDATGRRARRRSRKRLKLLRRIDVPLRAMLREGERVFFVTSGVLHPSFFDWYFLGWALYYLNRRAIVLTNQRILLLQIDSRKRPREMRNEISYTSVSRVKNTFLGNTKIVFHNGDKVLLTAIPRADRKWLAEIFDWFVEKLEVSPASTGLEHLCPHCYETVEGHPLACPACAIRFKRPKRAGRLSLVFPGAGDLYLGHNWFAVFEVIGATFVWAVLIVMAVDPTVPLTVILLAIGAVVVVVHGADAWTTRRIARKGLIGDTSSDVHWHFALAGLLPAVALITAVAAEPGKQRLRPAPSVVAGADLPADHLAALREAEYVGPDEAVRYFYSAAPFSMLQDGSLFTDDRIVSYEVGPEVDFHASARFDEVVDVHVVPAAAKDSLGLIYVVPETDEAFLLLVSPVAGGDTMFVGELLDRWRAVRSQGTGIWFDGGGGTSLDDAVVIHGVDTPEQIDDAERWWLNTWVGQMDTDWTLAGRRSTLLEAGQVDYVTVEYPDGRGRDEFVFRPADRPDLSDPADPRR